MTRCPRCQRRLPASRVCVIHGRPSTLGSIDGPLVPATAPPGYVLGHVIAIGGTSVVYAARSSSGTPAILKWGRWRDRDIHDRFGCEAELLRLLGAPLAPAYFAHGAIDDWPYVLMEDVPGETLAAWMARAGDHGSIAEVTSILARIAHTLEQLHARDYVHRDLKPENIVLDGHRARLLDFGLAAREKHVPGGAIAGTVHYLAPEQLKSGAAIDRRADIYAFGVIAFEMLAGQPPFVGERRAIEYQHQVVRPPSLRELREVPHELEAIVLGCLAKQPEARPQTARELVAQLEAATTGRTRLGVVAERPAKALGANDRVVLAWIEGGDPITIARAVDDVHGIVVRSRPGAVLAAFAAQFHDAPVAVALAACRALAHDDCRVVLHATTALVRRTAHGKPMLYGPDVEKPASWTPARRFTGLLLSGAAAAIAGSTEAAPDVAGFFREQQRLRTDATDVRSDVRLVGRERVIQDLAAIAGAGGMAVGVFGGEGAGKTRVLAAIVERLRAQKREVVAIRGRRRLLGDRPDDDRLLDALGGSSDLAQALAEAAARGAIVVIDDAHWFSPSVREQIVRDDLVASRVIASREPMFEASPGVTKRLVLELPPLAFPEAERLLRDLLAPARLIPDVLLQRLAIRAGGNPGLLVALARDIKLRGGVRRHEGSDDWYVAADEIDTLLAAPGAAWFAHRALDGFAHEVAAVVRIAAALGPKLAVDELTAVAGPSAALHLAELVHAGMLVERKGWFEFVDGSLQDAIYDHALDDKPLVHARALDYWLSHHSANLVGWLARVAHHAIGSGDGRTAATCSQALAREARRRGELALADALEQRAQRALGSVTTLAGAHVRSLDDRHAVIVGVVRALDEP